VAHLDTLSFHGFCLVLATVPHPRFGSGSGLERNWNRCNRFYPIKSCAALNLLYFGQFHNFANSKPLLQLSIWVLIISQYDIYVNNAVLDAISPHILHIAIWSIVVELLWNNDENWVFFAMTQQILIGLQRGEQEVKEHANLHLLGIYHIVIWSELKYLTGAKVLSVPKWGPAVCWTRPNNHGFICSPGNNPAKTKQDCWRVTPTHC